MDRIALPKTKGCLIEYTYIEVIHAAIQIILAFFGIVLSWLLAKYYYSAVDVKRKKAKKSNNMYSIEYSPQVRYDDYKYDKKGRPFLIDPREHQVIQVLAINRLAN